MSLLVYSNIDKDEYSVFMFICGLYYTELVDMHLVLDIHFVIYFYIHCHPINLNNRVFLKPMYNPRNRFCNA